MKTKILAVFAGLGVLLLAAGCVETVSGTKAFALSPGQDRFTNRYQRTPEQVYRAAVTVMNNDGVLLTEYIPHNTTNSVRALYGKVNSQKVWISVEPVDPNITQVSVEARTGAGLRDLNLAHELGTEIALQLQSMR